MGHGPTGAHDLVTGCQAEAYLEQTSVGQGKAEALCAFCPSGGHGRKRPRARKNASWRVERMVRHRWFCVCKLVVRVESAWRLPETRNVGDRIKEAERIKRREMLWAQQGIKIFFFCVVVWPQHKAVVQREVGGV